MTVAVFSAILLGALFAAMAVGVPLGFAAGGVASLLALFQFGPDVLALAMEKVYGMAVNYSFAAVPLFILMSSLLERSTIAQDLYDALQQMVGSVRGGVALVTLIIAVVLAAMSGIIGGEIVMLGLVALPQMLRLNYNRNMAIGVIVAGGSLGTMLPPSIVMIIFGLVGGVSIQKLFAATVVPGLILALSYLAYVVIRCWLNPAMAPVKGDDSHTPTMTPVRLLKSLVPPLLLITLILGCIYGGITSITEAACMGAVGTLIAIMLRGELSIPLLHQSLVQTLRSVGVLLWVTFGVAVLISVYNLAGGREFVNALLLDAGVSPLMTIVLMLAIFLVLGCFMDWIGIVLLTIPIFIPIVNELGYSPVWFGVLFCIAMQIAFLSPPFGSAAFYLMSVAPKDISLMDIYKSVWPFMAIQLVVLLLVLFLPDLALWLPNLN
ncbi:TRAP transporter large permease [Aidingimonas lacisalsi]|uniref:TRAP transporter large permease n=1 Tax=Aidingimonas lacisalsi TaxID=2604086 RepID=UPI0011D2C728|nr:TRAP transporter large permease subunit [Aidingimonas lacisalsi]